MSSWLILLQQPLKKVTQRSGARSRLSKLCLSSAGVCAEKVTGYGYIGPVCFEEYIFNPNAASHPHLRFKEYIFCIRFPDITGYGDIDHERFEDYIFVGYHCIDPGLFAEYISQYHLWRVEEYILGISMPINYRSITISSMATVVL